jgi:hypothetical protein
MIIVATIVTGIEIEVITAVGAGEATKVDQKIGETIAAVDTKEINRTTTVTGRGAVHKTEITDPIIEVTIEIETLAKTAHRKTVLINLTKNRTNNPSVILRLLP